MLTEKYSAYNVNTTLGRLGMKGMTDLTDQEKKMNIFDTTNVFVQVFLEAWREFKNSTVYSLKSSENPTHVHTLGTHTHMLRLSSSKSYLFLLTMSSESRVSSLLYLHQTSVGDYNNSL